MLRVRCSVKWGQAGVASCELLNSAAYAARRARSPQFGTHKRRVPAAELTHFKDLMSGRRAISLRSGAAPSFASTSDS